MAVETKGNRRVVQRTFALDPHLDEAEQTLEATHSWMVASTLQLADHTGLTSSSFKKNHMSGRWVEP